MIKKPNEIRAFMPGTIRAVFVKVGDNIEKGDKLLVLDAMKMDNELTAPIDGKVKKVSVKTGQTVVKNELLVLL
ncbi:MAG: acetyl-CoA carboxylase biotin carboxyl carrier protein subunit [Prevotellaceae bacterium]|jgi:biotin carboxyl carrier protein|nr:acetyl-CoA carboxylase biotin carboxyl carrier protein subunit [Prevotellaceae bacterium]